MKPIHTLLATTGASPQVVTETLYALHHENGQWPDEIFLITTTVGKLRAVEGLLDQGHLLRLCQQLQRPRPAFSAEHVLVVTGGDGKPVEDARSLADHEALANFIMTEVRNRTAVQEGSLHASLAGGRKTMTFYIGYAMSMFGRVQDSLSHVLVSEGYEGAPDFWFPTNAPEHRFIDQRGQTLDASAAQVTLAPIPFVRHRRDLPKVLLQDSEVVNFARLVQLINLGERPANLQIVVDLPQRSIQLCTRDGTQLIDFPSRSLIDLAFYALMARATVNGESDVVRPGRRDADKGLARMLIDELLALCHLRSKGKLDADLDALLDTGQVKDASVDSLREGVNAAWFDSRRTRLGQMFEQQLPSSLMRWVLPGIIWTEDGLRLPPEDCERTPKGGAYGIALETHQIKIVNMPE